MQNFMSCNVYLTQKYLLRQWKNNVIDFNVAEKIWTKSSAKDRSHAFLSLSNSPSPISRRSV